MDCTDPPGRGFWDVQFGDIFDQVNAYIVAGSPINVVNPRGTQTRLGADPREQLIESSAEAPKRPAFDHNRSQGVTERARTPKAALIRASLIVG